VASVDPRKNTAPRLRSIQLLMQSEKDVRCQSHARESPLAARATQCTMPTPSGSGVEPRIAAETQVSFAPNRVRVRIQQREPTQALAVQDGASARTRRKMGSPVYG